MLITNKYIVSLWVNTQISQLKWLAFFFRTSSAQDGFDSGDHFFGRERLGYIIVSTQFQADNSVRFICFGTENYDGEVAGFTDLTADLGTKQLRQNNKN